MSPILSSQFEDKVKISSLPSIAPSSSSSSSSVQVNANIYDLKNKKRKRNVHELKAETIPLNDVRRSYPRIFGTLMNRGQTEDIAQRLASIADPQSFVFVMHCKDLHDTVAPRYRELKGIDCAARFLGIFFQTTPDSIFVMRDHQFYKRSTSSQIHCNFELMGSIIYQMNIQNATCLVQSISSMVEKVGADNGDLDDVDSPLRPDTPEMKDVILASKSQDPSDASQSSQVGGSDNTVVNGPAEGVDSIFGLDALAHVADLLFCNQTQKRQPDATAPQPPESEISPTAEHDLNSKRAKRVEPMPPNPPPTSAAKAPTTTATTIRSSPPTRREKRAIIGNTLLSHSKITIEGNHVTSSTVTPVEGGPAYPVVNTAITSTKIFADKESTFSLGEKVSSANGINYSCVGQVIFHVNPSKRVERMELIYTIDHSVPNVMSKRPPSHGLYSVPSTINSYDSCEGLTTGGLANANGADSYSPAFYTNFALPSALSGLSGIAGLAGVAGYLAKQDGKAGDTGKSEIPDILSSPSNPSSTFGATPLFSI